MTGWKEAFPHNKTPDLVGRVLSLEAIDSGLSEDVENWHAFVADGERAIGG
jgi:hypothetical protein